MERRVNYKTKERRLSRFFGKRNGFGRWIYFVNIPRSIAGCSQGVSQSLLGEFKIPEGVKTYSQLTNFGDFRGFIYRAKLIWRRLRVEFTVDSRNRRC